ncbi:MAG: hypothetical protein WD229_08235 [Pirellulales bacterium]
MQDHLEQRLPLDTVHRVHAMVEARLLAHGFEPDAETGIYSRSRVAGLDDWVWLPADFSHDGRGVQITANLAIYCEPLVDWLRREHPTSASHLATLTRNIGHLLPRRRWHEWTLTVDGPIERGADEISATIEQYGLPWLADFETLEDLRDAFVTCGGKDHREISVARLDLHLSQLANSHRPARRKRFGAVESASARVGQGDPSLWICDD